MWSTGLLLACAALLQAKCRSGCGAVGRGIAQRGPGHGEDGGRILVATKRDARCLAGVERASLWLLASFGGKLGAVAWSLNDQLMRAIR